MMHSDLKPWQARIVEEKRELDVKINRLEIFMNGAEFFALEKEDALLMNRQLAHMKAYSGVLFERLDRLYLESGNA